MFKLNSINSSKKNIAIIGAGWFGCYIAYDLIKLGYKVKIFEKENKIFKGASGFNQNRLHQGFHYPRSYKTIKESKAGFNEFINIFPNLVKKIKKNLYVVVDNKNNLIDFEIYKQILKSNKLNFKIEKKNYGLKNYLGIISCDERLIDKKKAIEFFSNHIKKNIKLNSDIKKIIKKKKFFIIDNLKFDFVINCTWQTSFPAKKIKYTYEACLFFLYTCKDRNHPAITLMDGPFVTLYPAEKDIFTLYSVKYTRLKKFKKFNNCTSFMRNIKKEVVEKSRFKHEEQIGKYYPGFKNKFKFYKHVITYRTIIDNANAERTSKVIEKEKFINLLSGKIDHIFQSSKIIKRCLKRY